MISLMNSLYLYLKAIHIIAAFAWMAGMFYLPRLYVYHAQVGPNSPQAGTFKMMERRLLTVIMNPAMIVTVVLGLWLAFGADAVDPRAGWLHAKIALVVAMLVVHVLLAKWRKGFEAGVVPHSERFFRIINEVPTLLLIGIVILVVVRPF
jgi:protoporphyrinogen IX oxidase